MNNTYDNPKTLLDIARRHTAAARAEALVNNRIGPIPVWIRAPKTGAETYTGLTRSYLYQAAAQGLIRTVSIREPGKSALPSKRLSHLSAPPTGIELSRAAGGVA